MDRRTQTERRDQMRRRLIDAAVASLVERGWAATTSVEVCRRAGVTRGALVHHFADLPALLAASLASLYDDLVSSGPPPSGTLDGLVDATWSRLSLPSFKAVLEAWLAAANKPELRESLGPVIGGFAKLVSADELSTTTRLEGEERRAFYLEAREAMLGLAMGRALSGGQPLPHEHVVLDRLRREARRLDASERRDRR